MTENVINSQLRLHTICTTDTADMSFQLYAENIHVPIGKLSCFRYYCIRILHAIVFSVRKGFSRSVFYYTHRVHKANYLAESFHFTEKKFRLAARDFRLLNDLYGHRFRVFGYGLTQVRFSSVPPQTLCANHMGTRLRMDNCHVLFMHASPTEPFCSNH